MLHLRSFRGASRSSRTSTSTRLSDEVRAPRSRRDARVTARGRDSLPCKWREETLRARRPREPRAGDQLLYSWGRAWDRACGYSLERIGTSEPAFSDVKPSLLHFRTSFGNGIT